MWNFANSGKPAQPALTARAHAPLRDSWPARKGVARKGVADTWLEGSWPGLKYYSLSLPQSFLCLGIGSFHYVLYTVAVASSLVWTLAKHVEPQIIVSNWKIVLRFNVGLPPGVCPNLRLDLSCMLCFERSLVKLLLREWLPLHALRFDTSTQM